jgi:hypothetical protein
MSQEYDDDLGNDLVRVNQIVKFLWQVKAKQFLYRLITDPEGSRG